MPTYNAADLLTKPIPSIDQGITLTGTVTATANTVTGDNLRPLRIPAGCRIGALLINVRTAFGATAPASIGLSHTDGTAVPASVFGSATALTCIAAATDTSHATTGTKLVMPQIGGTALVTSKESNLEVTFGTVATGAQGVADYTLIGEFVGSR